MRISAGIAAVAVSTVLSTAITACGGSDPKVSVDKLQQAADKAIAAPTSACPLGFDVNAALKKAGVAATATPGDPTDPTALTVDADSATSADAGSIIKQRGGAMITCSYTLSGGGSLNATLLGIRTGLAMPVLAPMLNHDARLEMSTLATFISQKFKAGKAVVTPGAGLAAVAKLDGSGGDVLLEVTTDATGPDNADQDGPITGEPLGKLTAALAEQVRV